jgi:inosine-uridine nucleoside N-ribohydrolase
MELIRVLYDCDNTIGISGRDVDDGLALLYMLGRSDVCVEAVTATYGNGSLEEVLRATRTMFDELSIEGIPLLAGSPSPEQRISDAAEYLVHRAAEEPGALSLLATGSLTNLGVAQELDTDFFRNVKDIVIMGGVTDELVLGHRIMDELNLSCDPEAARTLFQSGASITIITGNLCMQALLERERYLHRTTSARQEVYTYLQNKLIPWFEHVEREFGIGEFHVWDVVAAVYLTDPSLFRTKRGRINSSIDELKRGKLRLESRDEHNQVKLPVHITDMEQFWELVFHAWERATV